MAQTNTYQIDEITVDSYLENGMIPVWIDDGKHCYWSAMRLPTGTIDCTFVQDCMQSTIDGLNDSINTIIGDITNIENNLTVFDNRITTLEGNSHTHLNKSILDNIDDLHGADTYFGGDGQYHPFTYGYDQITNNGNIVEKQHTVDFDDSFVVVNDTTNERTMISLADRFKEDTYLQTASFDNTTKIITLTLNNGTDIQVQLSNVALLGDDVYVVNGIYDNTNERIDLELSNGNHVYVDMNDVDNYVCCGSYDGTNNRIDLTLRNGDHVYIDMSSFGSATDNYVSYGTFNSLSRTLTLTLTNGQQVNISMADVQLTGDDDYVVSGVYDSLNSRIDLTMNSGNHVYIDMPTLTITEHSATANSDTSVTINHGLNRHPSFTPVDSTGHLVIPQDVQYVDANTAILTFSPAFTGTIYYI